MRVLSYFLVATALLCSCATQRRVPVEDREQVSYHDGNGDGKMDREKHQHPGMADADWELRDDDHNGRYERKILYGYAVTESVVDIRVPTGVKIEKIP